MTNKDRVPQSFYQMGLSLAVMEKQNEDIIMGDYKTSNTLSEDKTKLIIRFIFKSSLKHKEDEKTQTEIKRMAKSLFLKKPKTTNNLLAFKFKRHDIRKNNF